MALMFSGKFTVSPDVISQQYLEETILLNVKSLVYIRLDSLAGCLWQLLEQHDDIETVFCNLIEQQKLPKQQLEQLVNSCIGNFQRVRWITLP